MAVRCLAPALSLLVALLAAAPAAAQDFGFGPQNHAVSGLINSGVTGAGCATGILNFGAGGSVISANQSTCDGANFLQTGGSLTLDAADGDIFGTIGGDVLDGHVLPHGHAFVAATSFNARRSVASD